MRLKSLLILSFLLAVLQANGSKWRILHTEMVVEASVQEVWKAWTTESGVQSFFAPGSRIEPRVDGLYEIYFDPSAPTGLRGAEGMRILLMEPEKRFSFTWNAPPDNPEVRAQRTQVILEFEPRAGNQTLLRFTQLGWGSGPSWDEAYDYFDWAWNKVVLPRLLHRFQHGPIDWKAIPELPPVAPSLKAELRAPGIS